MTKDECDLCGLPLGESVYESNDGEQRFCCRGCRQVADMVEDAGSNVETSDSESALSGEGERTFVPVNGMHCVSCESFLEHKLSKLDGVRGVEANYASDLVGVLYDPDSIDEERIKTHLEGTGYSVTEDTGHDNGVTLARLIVGGFFGMMVMTWYVLFVYPMNFGVAPDSLLLDLTGPAGQYMYANIAVLTGVILIYTGFPILQGAYVGLRSRYPNMDILIAIAAVNAYLFSVVGLWLGRAELYFDITVVLIVVVSLGRYFEDRLKRQANERIEDQFGSSTESTVIDLESGEPIVPDRLDEGDQFRVDPGDTIPVDGEVTSGRASVDESLITGESHPITKDRGDTVIAGGVVMNSPLEIRATRSFEDSTPQRLKKRLWELKSSRIGLQKLADKLALIFVPFVLILAVGIFVYGILTGASLLESSLNAMTVLIVSCPCALGLAGPLTVISSLNHALKNNIVIKNPSIYELLPSLDWMAVDRTGTLSTGNLELVEPPDDSSVLNRAAGLEDYSGHPVGTAIRRACSDPTTGFSDVEEIPGGGISGLLDGQKIVVGNENCLREHGISLRETDVDRAKSLQTRNLTPVIVGWNGTSRGVIGVGDTLRSNWDSFLDDLEKRGKSVVILTGGSGAVESSLINHPTVEDVISEAKPEAKVRLLNQYSDGEPVGMVGDGSNDAPSLAQADVGIALGGGTSLAARAGDAVIVDDSLSGVTETIDLADATNRRLRQNLAWAFLYNAIAIPAAILGYLNPLVAAVAMASSSLIVVLNSFRRY